MITQERFMKMLALLEVKYLFFLRHVYPSVLPFIQEISAEDLLSTVFWNEWCLALGQGTVNENCCCCSVTTSCQTLCDPMDCIMPGFPVLHYLLECTQIHVHWVNDAIQPSHPVSPPSPLAFNLFQHQSLFQWVSPSHQVAKVLELQHFFLNAGVIRSKMLVL